MTRTEFCNLTGLKPKTLDHWIYRGAIKAELVVGRGRGGFRRRREFTSEHVERVRVVKALLAKHIPFVEMMGRPDLFTAAYIVFDGYRAQPCQDAAAAIATVAKARRKCTAVDLTAIRATP
jgi:hypothetical protein